MASDKPTGLLSVPGTQTVGLRAACVPLAGCNQLGEVFAVILNFQVRLVADVGLCDWLWCTLNIAAIGSDSRVDSGD